MSVTAGAPRTAPGGRGAPARRRAAVLRLGPNVVLAGAALMALTFITWQGSMAALAFLLAGFALWARRPDQAVEDLVRFWPVHLLAAWCLLSAFWSNEPGITLRLGIQLALTLVIAVAMATRLSAATFVRLVFAAGLLAMLFSLLLGRVRPDGAGWEGVFGSKNEFAFAMSTAVLASLAVALDRRAGWLRPAGAAGVLLGAALLAQGQSAGAMVSTALAGLAGLLLLAQSRLSAGLRLLLAALALLGAAACGLAAWGFRAELADLFLGVTGKDVTLTGRTELWAEAFREIAAHPWLGQGFQAFWVPGNPVAEALWAEFGIASRMGFHFHNTWISNAVEIGLLGVGLQLALFGATLVLVGRWALGAQTAASLFFAMFMARQAATSLVEVVAYLNFNVTTLISVAALVYGLRVRSEVGAGPAPGERRRPLGLRPPAGPRAGAGSP